MAPSDKVCPVKRCRSDRAPVWRLAPGGVRCPPGGLEPGSA